MSPPQQQNLSSTTPPAPSGKQNITWQKDSSLPRNDSANIPGTGSASTQAGNYTVATGDCGALLAFTGSSTATFLLPAIIPFARWCVFIQNDGSAALTVSPNGLNIDGGASSLTLNSGQGMYVATNGANYFTQRGSAAAAVNFVSETPSGAMNGGNIVFALSYAPNPAASLALTLNGVGQTLGVDATVTGSRIVYAVPPKSSDYQNARYTH